MSASSKGKYSMKAETDRSETIKRLFLQDKPAEILISIANMNLPYASRILKEVDTTFAHAVKILSAMEELGIIETEKSGRIKNLKLTPHGEALAESLKNFLAVCETDLDEKEEKTKNIADRTLSKLDQIYSEEIEGKKRLKHKDGVRISRRLAPYERELKRLAKLSKAEDDPSIIKVEKKIKWIKREKEKLMSS